MTEYRSHNALATMNPEQHLAPSVSYELYEDNGLVVPLDSPAIGALELPDGTERKYIAKMDIPTLNRDTGDAENDIQIYISYQPQVTTGKRKNKRTEPAKIIYTEVQNDGTVQTREQPTNYDRYTYGKANVFHDQGDPGLKARYTYDAVPVAPSKKGEAGKVALSVKPKELGTGLWSAENNPRKAPRYTTAQGSSQILPVSELIAEAAGANKRQASREKSAKHRRIARKAGTFALITGGIVGSIAASLHTGGVYDKALDHRHSARSYIEQQFGNSHNKQQQAAVDRVALTMQELDDHNTTAVLQGAEAFQELHGKDLIPVSAITDYKNLISQATTDDEVFTIASDYMKRYFDKTFGPTEPSADGLSYDSNGHTTVQPYDPAQVSLEQLKATALGVVDFTSELPISLIKDGAFGEIDLGTQGPKDGDLGVYISNPKNGFGTINIAANAAPADKMEAGSALTTAHEWKHSDDDQLNNYSAADPVDTFSDEMRKLFDEPNEVSGYAEANDTHDGQHSNEFTAENFAYLVGPDGTSSLAHPDDVRLFESEANKKMLSVLVQLEERYPGISGYLVAKLGLTDYKNYNLPVVNQFN